MIKMTAFVEEMKPNWQRIKRKKQQDSDLAARVTTQHSVKLHRRPGYRELLWC